jgi:molybdenum cofactor sulfurtransferase
MTGQSNVTNTKNPLSLLALASEELGYSTLLDAAALAPTSRISLTHSRGVDAMAVSFYKMFGYPTGVGALIAKREFLARLSRPWFAGGTVDIVQAPGLVMTMADDIRERFEVCIHLYFHLHFLCFFSGLVNFLVSFLLRI